MSSSHRPPLRISRSVSSLRLQAFGGLLHFNLDPTTSEPSFASTTVRCGDVNDTPAHSCPGASPEEIGKQGPVESVMMMMNMMAGTDIQAPVWMQNTSTETRMETSIRKVASDKHHFYPSERVLMTPTRKPPQLPSSHETPTMDSQYSSLEQVSLR